ncbi:WD repeat-containing protein 76-like isoform X2 [Stegodyphus dumicola]|uniref:WD repeat-containing protein 76-like isoform X2 n=1 Tax=Stegodyphus dumicola TaxID=202533 RepID=UPI0015AABA65|nr:WD repeat-containing protein 76-like isoform X2 [Stegodyphus dumicola]
MDRLINVPLCVLASFRDENAEIRCKPISRTRNLEESSENNKGAQQFKLKDIPIDTGMKTRKYPKVEKEMDEDCDPEEDEVYEEWKPEKKKGNKDLKPWSGVSEIERLALKNREEHLALLRSLKIEQAKEDFIQAVEELKPKMKPKPVKRVYKSKPSSPPVLRKSKRLAKMSVDLSEGALYAKAIEKAEEEAEEIIKKEIPPILPFKDALHSKGVYEDFDKDFRWASNENSTYECDLSSNADNRYVSRFPFMKVDESKVAKVVPARITAMALNPLPDRIIVTAADKYGNMGFWKVDSESDPYLFEVHYQNIPHLQYNPVNPNMILSCSYDGSVRCGDLENRIFSEVYVDEYSSCSYFDFLSPTSLIVGKKSGCIAVVDFRNGKSSAKSHECHEHPIKTDC